MHEQKHPKTDSNCISICSGVILIWFKLVVAHLESHRSYAKSKRLPNGSRCCRYGAYLSSVFLRNAQRKERKYQLVFDCVQNRVNNVADDVNFNCRCENEQQPKRGQPDHKSGHDDRLVDYFLAQNGHNAADYHHAERGRHHNDPRYVLAHFIMLNYQREHVLEPHRREEDENAHDDVIRNRVFEQVQGQHGILCFPFYEKETDQDKNRYYEQNS